MRKISEKLSLQLDVENDSIKLYNSFIKKIDDASINKKIKFIRDDEIEHAKLVEKMISLVKGEKSSEKIEKTEKIIPEGFLDKYNSIFITVNVSKYPSTIIGIAKQLNLNCIYISFNKMPKYIKSLLVGHEIDTNMIHFIECVQSKEGNSVDPKALTELSIKISELMDKLKNNFFIIVDTISSFSVYHEENIILKFVSLINSEVLKYKAGAIWIAINGEAEKSLNERIASLCNHFLKK